MALYRSISERMQDQSNGLIGRDEPEPVRPLLPPPAPAGIMDYRPGQAPQGVDPNTTQGDGGFFSRLFGGNDPNLSPEDNARIQRHSMLLSGLATLASDRPGLKAVAEGLMAGNNFAFQARTRARGELAEAGRKANRSRFLEVLTQGNLRQISPRQLTEFAQESVTFDDGETLDHVMAEVERRAASQQAEQQAAIQDAANGLEIEYFNTVNADPSERGAVIDELRARADEGDQSATLALRSIEGDSSERELRRDKIGDDLSDDAVQLNNRARAFRNVLATPNPTDLEIINNFLSIETGNPSASARTVAQFAEQTAVMPFLQPIKDIAEGRTSELDSDVRAQMLSQIRAKESQFRREAARFDERLTRRSTAARIEKASIFPESPTDILRDIDAFRAQSQGQRPAPTIDPGDGGQPVPASALPTLGQYLPGGGQ